MCVCVCVCVSVCVRVCVCVCLVGGKQEKEAALLALLIQPSRAFLLTTSCAHPRCKTGAYYKRLTGADSGEKLRCAKVQHDCVCVCVRVCVCVCLVSCLVPLLLFHTLAVSCVAVHMHVKGLEQVGVCDCKAVCGPCQRRQGWRVRLGPRLCPH